MQTRRDGLTNRGPARSVPAKHARGLSGAPNQGDGSGLRSTPAAARGCQSCAFESRRCNASAAADSKPASGSPCASSFRTAIGVDNACLVRVRGPTLVPRSRESGSKEAAATAPICRSRHSTHAVRSVALSIAERAGAAPPRSTSRRARSRASRSPLYAPQLGRWSATRGSRRSGTGTPAPAHAPSVRSATDRCSRSRSRRDSATKPGWSRRDRTSRRAARCAAHRSAVVTGAIRSSFAHIAHWAQYRRTTRLSCAPIPTNFAGPRP